MDKKGIRNLGKLLRKGEKIENFEEKVYSHLSMTEEYKKASIVMIYLNLPAEAPTGEIVKKILSDGKRVCVPVTENFIITPCEVSKSTTFLTGAFGVREPSERKTVKAEEIDVCIIPGLLFDRRGNRCGYGKGCYDRFLEGNGCVKIGLCFESQLAESFPSEEYDVKMNMIITEKGLITCEK